MAWIKSLDTQVNSCGDRDLGVVEGFAFLDDPQSYVVWNCVVSLAKESVGRGQTSYHLPKILNERYQKEQSISQNRTRTTPVGRPAGGVASAYEASYGLITCKMKDGDLLQCQLGSKIMQNE